MKVPSGKAPSFKVLVLFVIGVVSMVKGIFVPAGKFDAPATLKAMLSVPTANTEGTVLSTMTAASSTDDIFFQACARSVFIEWCKDMNNKQTRQIFVFYSCLFLKNGFLPADWE